ncbi:MAG: ammonium transporter [Rhodospirillaceae bacterium]|nr:MAG: ammonium transporter [Rhodospirillaceae bacterium]
MLAIGVWGKRSCVASGVVRWLMVVPGFAGIGGLAASPAWAQAKPTLNSGDTAWMLTATALVLMMTIPGLALFYGGMVRKMNVLSVIMQSFAITCLVSVLWMIAGYSLAFMDGNAFIGDLSRIFLKGMEVNALSGTIPESVFVCFQMTFAIITPALITGAFADRMKFSALLLFTALWSLLVYAPIAHMVWGATGLMFNKGILDFAGGTVVHINAGIGGLVAALVIGKRHGYGRMPMPPHNLVYSVTGAGLLWVGWFGFNAGSALTSGGTAGMAMTVTQIATAAAGLSWMFVEWALKKHPSVLGIISGAVAGLVAITPASGFVDPTGALIIGLVAGIVCFFGATTVKNLLGYDDALDAFGVHGIGGIIGAILTGVFATQAVKGGDAPVGLIDGNGWQVVTQIEGILLTILWSGIGTFIILKVVDLIVGLRVAEEIERDGLDLGLHGETVP